MPFRFRKLEFDSFWPDQGPLTEHSQEQILRQGSSQKNYWTRLTRRTTMIGFIDFFAMMQQRKAKEM